LRAFAVVRGDETPLYRQICEHIRTAIRTGQLRPGDRVPSTRGLADQFGTARGTVDAAYAILAGEGYLVGRAIIAALEKVNGEPTRQALVEAVQNTGSFDLGGFKLSYSASSNRGSNQVFLTVIQPDGSFKAVDRLEKSGT